MSDITIFTDGASRGNPGRGGWGAIVKNEDIVTEIGGREDNTTNNRMEMRAVLEAFRLIANEDEDKKIEVYIDSSYVVNGITKWVVNWKKNNWKTKQKVDVMNRDLWEEIVRLTEGKDIDWKLLEGHVGIPGNERCDEIASSLADNKDLNLYNGDADDYKVNLSITKSDSTKKVKKDRSKMKAYSYLSFTGGKVTSYKTWAECEASIKGKANAKFRKAISKEDEDEILSEWGVSFDE